MRQGAVRVPWSAPVTGFFSWIVSDGSSTKGSSCAEKARLTYKSKQMFKKFEEIY